MHPSTSDPTEQLRAENQCLRARVAALEARLAAAQGAIAGDVIPDRRLPEDMLCECERRLSTLFDILPAGIFILDARGAVVYVNPAMERIVQLAGADLRAGAYRGLRYLRPDGTPRPVTELAGARAFYERRPVFDVETGIVTEAGSLLWVSASAVPVEFSDWRVVVVTADITARKQAEEALRAALTQSAAHAARLDSLLANAPVGISLLDAELRYQAINAAMAALNGIPREAHLGRTIGEMLPDIAPLVEPTYARVLATGEPLIGVEIVGETPAQPGVSRAWQGTFFPVRAADRTILGVGAIIIEITAQRQLERALQVEHQQLATTLEMLDEGVLAFHPDGTLVTLNSAVRSYLGWPADWAPTTLDAFQTITRHQLYDRDGLLLAPGEYPFARVLRGEPFHDMQVRFVREDDSIERWFTFTGAMVYGADGQVLLSVLSARETTAQRQVEQALRSNAAALSRSNAELTRALRLKDEFLAMMSHELRTPLTIIIGIAESMEDDLYGAVSAEAREALGTLIQSGRHLLAILSDILDLAQIESGQAELDVEAVDVELLCDMVLQLMQRAAQQRGVRLMCTVEQGVRGLCADNRRLTQILVNLLDNAVKFTPADGTVGLEARGDPAQGQIQFVVWDTGIGIAANDIARLFQPFTQLDARLSRQYGGIGLGLSLVRRLVEMHGGSVRLDSEPGQGSRFTVSLPWDPADNYAPPAACAAAALAPTWAGPPHVLIADDHEPTLAFYRDLLISQGCTVDVARTGEEALRQLRADRPDVAVLDIQMPGIDGLEAIRRIRGDPALAAIPIIALTALAMPGDRERCMDAGASLYLAKPVGLRALIAAIAQVLPGDG